MAAVAPPSAFDQMLMDDDPSLDAGPLTEGQPGEEGGTDVKKKAPTKPRKKARRVTVDLLLGDSGLPKLNSNIRDKGNLKRTGNMAKDSRRLVALYENWGQGMLPTVPFPEFVQQIEKLSGNQKLMMKQMALEQGGDDTWDTGAAAQQPAEGANVQDDWGDIAAPAPPPQQQEQQQQQQQFSQVCAGLACPLCMLRATAGCGLTLWPNARRRPSSRTSTSSTT